MNTPKPLSYFRTSDIYMAAYLKVSGVPFVGMERKEQRVFFLFDEGDGISDLKLQYFNNHSKVPARPFAEEIKAFKSLIHNG